MDPSRQLAATVGLLLGTGWLLVEALYLAMVEPDVVAWSVPLSVGVGAPGALLMGLLTMVGWTAWCELPWWEARRGDWRRRTVDWWWRGEPEDLTWRSAWFLATMALVGLWSVIVMAVDMRIGATVNTPSLGAGLTVLVSLTAAVLLAVAAPVVVVSLRWPLSRVASRGRLGALLVRPGTWAGGLVALCLLALLLVRTLHAEVWLHLPWVFVVGPLGGVAVAWLGVRAVLARPGARKGILVCLTGGMLALGVFALLLPDGLRGGRRIFTAHASAAHAWVEFVSPWLDHDGDGASSYFGGQDCAPHDAAIGPHQREIVDNGVDEDCTGEDLTVNPADFKKGQTSHPLPKGLAKRPHIILLTTDALSGPHTTVAGYERDTTPRLAAWAERATVFSEAFGTSCSTRLSFPGIVTGHLNAMVRMQSRKRHPFFYDTSVRTTASMLKGLGYRTVHIPGADYFTAEKWGGYWRGFDVVDEETFTKAEDPLHTAAELTDAAIAQVL
ncbi:MAG: sulfatase-like hydrolase/transferase, partial [Myxococcota bacterium]|nr:sulfatase-like hydrolase/transferase [Myxococcota bacterium]